MWDDRVEVGLATGAKIVTAKGYTGHAAARAARLATRGPRAGFAAGFLAGVVLALSAACAYGVTVGADLRRPANAPYGCESLPTTDAFGNRFFLPTGSTSCTYVGTGALGSQQEVAQAPRGGGLVTLVRVRAGPVTGPTQVTVLRATRSGVGFACCFYAGASPVFRPAPNSITTLRVRLPVRSDLNPAFGETVDYLGISVLAPGVPIPAQELGNPGNPFQPGALAFFPFVRPGDERADGAGVIGIVPLVNADIVPLCPLGGPVRADCVPAVSVGLVRTGGTTIALPLACNLAVDCAGTILLQSTRAAIARKTHKIIYASARFRIPSGDRANVRTALTRSARSALHKHKRLRVYAVIVADGRTSNIGRVTLGVR